MKQQRTPPEISDDWVAIAKFGRPTGLKGHLRLFTYSRDPAQLAGYQPWTMRSLVDGATCPLPLCEALEVGDKCCRVKLTGIDNREAAERYTNTEVVVSGDTLPALAGQQYYWHQLIGLTVVNVDGECLGQVSHLFETGANDVLVVAGEDKQRLIPYLEGDVIVDIDLAERRLNVDWDKDF